MKIITPLISLSYFSSSLSKDSLRKETTTKNNDDFFLNLEKERILNKEKKDLKIFEQIKYIAYPEKTKYRVINNGKL